MYGTGHRYREGGERGLIIHSSRSVIVQETTASIRESIEKRIHEEEEELKQPENSEGQGEENERKQEWL